MWQLWRSLRQLAACLSELSKQSLSEIESLLGVGLDLAHGLQFLPKGLELSLELRAGPPSLKPSVGNPDRRDGWRQHCQKGYEGGEEYEVLHGPFERGSRALGTTPASGLTGCA